MKPQRISFLTNIFKGERVIPSGNPAELFLQWPSCHVGAEASLSKPMNLKCTHSVCFGCHDKISVKTSVQIPTEEEGFSGRAEKSRMRWELLILSALGRLGQESHKFSANLRTS